MIKLSRRKEMIIKSPMESLIVFVGTKIYDKNTLYQYEKESLRYLVRMK